MKKTLIILLGLFAIAMTNDPDFLKKYAGKPSSDSYQCLTLFKNGGYKYEYRGPVTKKLTNIKDSGHWKIKDSSIILKSFKTIRSGNKNDLRFKSDTFKLTDTEIYLSNTTRMVEIFKNFEGGTDLKSGKQLTLYKNGEYSYSFWGCVSDVSDKGQWKALDTTIILKSTKTIRGPRLKKKKKKTDDDYNWPLFNSDTFALAKDRIYLSNARKVKTSEDKRNYRYSALIEVNE
jgi:predicted transport protein